MGLPFLSTLFFFLINVPSSSSLAFHISGLVTSLSSSSSSAPRAIAPPRCSQPSPLTVDRVKTELSNEIERAVVRNKLEQEMQRMRQAQQDVSAEVCLRERVSQPVIHHSPVVILLLLLLLLLLHPRPLPPPHHHLIISLFFSSSSVCRDAMSVCLCIHPLLISKISSIQASSSRPRRQSHMWHTVHLKTQPSPSVFASSFLFLSLFVFVCLLVCLLLRISQISSIQATSSRRRRQSHVWRALHVKKTKATPTGSISSSSSQSSSSSSSSFSSSSFSSSSVAAQQSEDDADEEEEKSKEEEEVLFLNDTDEHERSLQEKFYYYEAQIAEKEQQLRGTNDKQKESATSPHFIHIAWTALLDLLTAPYQSFPSFLLPSSFLLLALGWFSITVQRQRLTGARARLVKMVDKAWEQVCVID